MSINNVGIIICSKDILNNRKCDCSSQFLIQELNSMQFTVTKLTVVPDSEDSILNELVLSIKHYDIMIIISDKCGIPYKALARMISEKPQEREELIKYFAKTGEPYDKAEISLPSQAKVIFDNDIYPVVHFQRVFILKEKYLRKSFTAILKSRLLQYKKPRNFQKIVKISRNGNSVSELNDINKMANDSLTLQFSKEDQFYVFKISSPHLANVVDFEMKIKDKFELYQLTFLNDSEAWENVYRSNESHVQNAIHHIEESLERFGLDNVFVSFNGGKDCTVLLHLILTVIFQKYPHYTKPILCLYVQSEVPFPEQEEFINLAKAYYNLKVITIKSGIKDALQQILAKFPNYKACFMGTRRTDPYSSDLNVFQMTDSNWPQIMRINPLLDWHYSDIWDYLLYYKVPYCELYNMGFTSLGNTVNTVRNPSLIYFDQFEEKEKYLPAYKLLNEITERNGRETN